MNKVLFTTGQIIDHLDIGETAETEDRKYKAFLTEHGLLVIQNEHGNVGLNATVLSSMWRIIPKYVSFEEAFSAINEGKSVIWIYGEKEKLFNKNSRLHDIDLGCFTFKILQDSKWLIKG